MSSIKWHVRRSGREFGPYSTQQLKDLAKQGKILSDMEVRRDTDSVWRPASKVKGLLDIPKATASPSPRTAQPDQHEMQTESNDGTPKWIWAFVATVATTIIILSTALISSARQNAKQREIDNANQSILEAVDTARSLAQKGNFDDAKRVVDDALNNDHATIPEPGTAMLIELETQRAEVEATKLSRVADNAIKRQDLRSAIEALQELVSIHGITSNTQQKATDLIGEIDLAMSEEAARDVLRQLSEAQFETFVSTGELPPSAQLKSASLNEIFQHLCHNISDHIAEIREQDKNRRIAENRAIERKKNAGKELMRFDGVFTTNGMAISSNKQLVSWPDADNNCVVVWNIATGAKQLTLSPPQGQAIDISSGSITAFSPDSRYLACTVRDDRRPHVLIWDLDNGKVIQALVGMWNDDGQDSFSCLAITSDYVVAGGTHYSSVGEDQHPVRIWDRQSGRLIRTFEGHSETVRCVATSPDEKYIVTGGEDRLAILWEIENAREIQLFDAHASSVHAISYSPNGNSILTGGFDCSVYLWDVESGKVRQSWRLGEYDRHAETEWKMANLRSQINSLTGGIPPLHLWSFPTVQSIDFSTEGDRAVVGLGVMDPALLHRRSNPMILDLNTNDIVELPSHFIPTPLSRVWAAFNEGGNAVIFNRTEQKRVRGAIQEITYLSVTGVP